MTYELLRYKLRGMEAIDVVLRPATADDVSFIFATWLNNFKNSSYHAKRIRKDVFYREHHKVIEDLLPNCSVLVATPSDDSNTILGYIVAEPADNIVHFTYVKAAFRNLGIAKQLIFASLKLDTCVKFTHWSFVMDELMEKYPHLEYNPYLAYV